MDGVRVPASVRVDVWVHGSVVPSAVPYHLIWRPEVPSFLYPLVKYVRTHPTDMCMFLVILLKLKHSSKSRMTQVQRLPGTRTQELFSRFHLRQLDAGAF